jgi:succinate dehydrogenase / fumarate reductase membrane anchor subunit
MAEKSQSKTTYGSSGRFEVLSWYFMRVSGAILLIIAVFHLFYMHVIAGVDAITFEWIVDERWNGPAGAFWRTYDLALLGFALFHGINGTRWVIDDYFHRRGWNLFLKSALYVVGVILFVMGAQVVFTVQLDSTQTALSAVAAVFGQ